MRKVIGNIRLCESTGYKSLVGVVFVMLTCVLCNSGVFVVDVTVIVALAGNARWAPKTLMEINYLLCL